MSKKIILAIAILVAFMIAFGTFCYFFLGPISAMLVGQCLTILLTKYVLSPILFN